MRFVVVLCVVVGCYRPSLEDTCSVLCGPGGLCPARAHCEGTRCVPDQGSCARASIDAIDSPDLVPELDAFQTPDAMLDAFGSTNCTAVTPNYDAILINGTDFTRSDDYMRAVKLDGPDISEFEGPTVLGTSPSFAKVLHAPLGAIAQISAPRLSPDGNTIFFRGEDGAGNGTLYVSTRAGVHSWSSPVALKLLDASNQPVAVDATTRPGTPTALSPRRMAIQSSGGFWEYEEIANNKWRQKFQLTTAALGLTLLTDPNLTSDGLRIVFSATSATFTTRDVWIMQRLSLAQPFATPLRFYADLTNGATASPVYASDCGRLFYTAINGPRIATAH